MYGFESDELKMRTSPYHDISSTTSKSTQNRSVNTVSGNDLLNSPFFGVSANSIFGSPSTFFAPSSKGNVVTMPQENGVEVSTLKAMNADMYNKVSKLPVRMGYRVGDAEIKQMGMNPAEFNDDKTGMHAGLYHLPQGGYVVAYEGSNDLAAWKTNALQGLNMDVPAYTEAARVAKDVVSHLKDNVVYTGPSLGGGEASVAALVTGKPAYTFNAEGVNQTMIQKLNLPVGEANQLITAYQKSLEPLTTAQKFLPIPEALGNLVTVPVTTNDVKQFGRFFAPQIGSPTGMVQATVEMEHYLHSMNSFTPGVDDL